MSFLLITLVLSTPLILSAIGGYTSERSGVINIALEGKMLMAACVTALCSWQMGAVAGVAMGIAAACVLSALHWMLTQKYRIDPIVSGMAINAFALGGTNFLSGRFDDPSRGTNMPRLPLEFYYVLALALPLALAWYAVRTRGGLRMVAVGSDPAKADLMGISPSAVRFWALIATGVFCGLAGAMLVTDTGGFTDNMTAGRGYIALAALILAGWRPFWAMIACLGFGVLSSLRLQLQGSAVFGAELPSEVWASLPYLATVIALAGLLGRTRTPTGLGKL